MFDRRREVEAVGEELGRAGQHQLVRLADGDVCDAGNVGYLALGLLVARRLRGHVDGRGGHGNWRTALEMKTEKMLMKVRKSFIFTHKRCI